MVAFPWDITFGLAIVLTGTAAAITYILMLDHLESNHADEEGLQQKDDQ
jgi:hypothetical protein